MVVAPASGAERVPGGVSSWVEHQQASGRTSGAGRSLLQYPLTAGSGLSRWSWWWWNGGGRTGGGAVHGALLGPETTGPDPGAPVPALLVPLRGRWWRGGGFVVGGDVSLVPGAPPAAVMASWSLLPPVSVGCVGCCLRTV